jgi:hypothetical protein
VGRSRLHCAKGGERARIDAKMTRAPPRFVGGPPQGGCSPPRAIDPVNIPHDVENRRVATRFDQELNPQINGPSRVPPQVMESAGSTSQGGDTGSNPVGTTRNAAGQGPCPVQAGRAVSFSSRICPAADCITSRFDQRCFPNPSTRGSTGRCGRHRPETSISRRGDSRPFDSALPRCGFPYANACRSSASSTDTEPCSHA